MLIWYMNITVTYYIQRYFFLFQDGNIVVTKEDSKGWVAAIAAIFSVIGVIVILLLLFILLSRKNM